MWMNETVASGMVPYHHIIGGETGMGEDRRSLEPARDFFNWTAKHDPHFINKRYIANIGVVMGQRVQLFYRPPHEEPIVDYMHGLYYALAVTCPIPTPSYRLSFLTSHGVAAV
jgi:hypothetical protein